MKKYFLKTRSAAIILIAVGYGWTGGDYIPGISSLLDYILQFIIIAGLLIMGTRSLSGAESEHNPPNWSVTAFSIFSPLLLLITIFNITYWNHASHAGSIDALNGYAAMAAIILLIAGNILWFISIVQGTRNNRKSGFLTDSHYNIL